MQVTGRDELVCAWCGPSLAVMGGAGAPVPALGGFYFREARHLLPPVLTVNGHAPWPCQTVAQQPDLLRADYVYPERARFAGGGTAAAADATGDDGLPHRALDLRVACRVDCGGCTFILTIANRSDRTLTIDVALALAADFADLQEALGGTREQVGGVSRQVSARGVHFACDNAALPYRTDVVVHGSDWSATPAGVRLHLVLEPRVTRLARLAVLPDDGDRVVPAAARARRLALERWRRALTRVAAPGAERVGETLRRNIADFASLPLLDGPRAEWLAPVAGVPLYPAFFGRDAVTAGWQAAMLDRGTQLEASLTRLGRLQGRRVDPARDEEPGRLVQQVRTGPLARLRRTPFAAYYGDYAAPFMFIVGLAHRYAWRGERRVVARHWDTARRVLDWARTQGDADGDGYLEYATRAPQGPRHQGWKDSGNAVVYDDGTPVPPPVATCELQGYWYAAQQMMAVLSWVMGADDDARAHRAAAADLRRRFNRDWWMPEEGCPALALDRDKRLVRAVGSNIGHCLASGIVDAAHLPPLVGRLFAPDLFSGWGIRTLSARHAAFDPVSYHLGSVWPVESATVAFGLRRFGFDDRALDLARALFDLAACYPEGRVPECVGGDARRAGTAPAVYPRANAPQLWNAGAFPLMLHTLLGLQPVAPLGLLVVDPRLPSWLPAVTLTGLRIGGARLTLRFWRGRRGGSHVKVVHRAGTVRVVKQPPPESLHARPRDRMAALFDTLLH